MAQIHKRFTGEQIKLLFQSYCQGKVSRADLQEMIGIGKSRFFVLLKAYRDNPDCFTIAYQWETNARISPAAEAEIEKALLQDRIVRTRFYEKLSQRDEVRSVLKAELDRCNNQVHSTTGEIPPLRFEKARKSGNCLLRKFSFPPPYTSPTEVFWLRERRRVNSYRRISLFKNIIDAPEVPLLKYVDVYLVPDQERDLMDIRTWWNRKMVHSVSLPLQAVVSSFELYRCPVFIFPQHY